MDIRLPGVGSSQFYGIIIGCIVYALTILAVCVLFVKGGSLTRLQDEASNPSKPDALINLPLKPILASPGLLGRFVRIRMIKTDNLNDLASIFEISNGSAVYGSCSYDSFESIWRNFRVGPFYRPEELHALFEDLPDNMHLIVEDATIERVIGSVSLTKNDPSRLSITIENAFCTPSHRSNVHSTSSLFSTKDDVKRHFCTLEAAYLVFRFLFALGYRRISTSVPTANIAARKYCMKIGMVEEGYLRRAEIRRNSSEDLIVFSVVNSDWFSSIKRKLEIMLYSKVLKRYQGQDLKVGQLTDGLCEKNDGLPVGHPDKEEWS